MFSGSQTAFNASTPSLGYMQIDNSSALTFVGFGNLTAAWTDVGFNAEGTINMGWGSHTVNGDLRLGVNSGSQGNYNMGSGILSSINEFVGNQGTGVFTQTGGTNYVGFDINGNSLNSFSELIVGRFTGSNGTYELSGGKLVTTREIVGDAKGLGTFNQSGSSIHTIDQDLIIGQDAWINGTDPSGSFCLQDNAKLTVTGNVYLGDEGGYGKFAQSDESESIITNSLIIGGNSEDGEGVSTGEYIQNGGINTIGGTDVFGALILGNQAETFGAYELNGGTLIVGCEEYVGNFGTGVIFQNGGTHTLNGAMYVGLEAGGYGEYHMKGSGSQLTATDHITMGSGTDSTGKFYLNDGNVNAGYVHVGRNGAGEFEQTGGTLTTDGDLVLANDTGSSGTYTLSGDPMSSILTVGGSTFIGMNGEGHFNQTGGTNTTDSLYIGGDDNGTYNLSNGTLMAANIVTDGTFNYNDSATLDFTILSGSGTFAGNLTNNATVAPGNSPGTLTIDGEYVQTDIGSLLIEIGGYTQGSEYDFLNITGAATLTGFLKVDLYETFIPENNSYFDILYASGGLSGVFEEYEMYKGWTVDYLDLVAGNGIDTVRVTANAVPVPATMWLLLSGMIGLIGIRRRSVE
ncbi:MAG: hypothetical protein C0403_06040 [Desulfobacterium sp.]|nr:hypothetical protein [Desulfobacterium sp.]